MGHFAIDVAVAVVVLREVAVHAVHALFHVDRGKVHGLAELLRVVVAHLVARGIEQLAVPVALVDGAKIPAVTVIVRELRVMQLRVEVGDAAEKVRITP